jgi:AraC family ethanolamine operon transcriptional activator
MPAGTFENRTIQFSDSDQLSEFFIGWDGRFEQLTAGKFAGSLHIAQGPLVRVVSARFNQKLLLHGHAGSGLSSIYLVDEGNADSLWHGRRLSPGQIVMHGPQATTDHRTARPSADFGLTMSADKLANSIRTLLGGEHPGIPPTWSVFDSEPRAYAALLQRIRTLLNHRATNSTQSSTPESDRLEQECVRCVVRALFETGRSSETPLSFPSRAALVRRAEELMRSHFGEPLGVIDLCRQLGVSDRTLRLAFRERFGLGPIAYFQAIRLNAVRAALKSTNGNGRIAQIAQRNGFSHLGNFAAAYRRLFGERPSTTWKQRSSKVE